MDRIMTLHPDPAKQGVHIDKAKYDLVREAIVASVHDHGEITFKALTEDVGRRLAGRLDGSVPWYVISVKLDLEARGVVRRLPKSRPQRVCLV
jgi:hypothetical protein